jgi:adenosylcobinamide kinase/adenosylcobinamide-phosphate guanylyltransferase
MAEIIFVTGPTRSGKSRRAVEIAQGWGDDVVFIATYRSDPDDAEMVERVRLHCAERNAKWCTLEAPSDIAQALADLRPAPSGAVIDSLTLWLADRFDQGDARLIAEWERIRSLSWATRLAGHRCRSTRRCAGFAIWQACSASAPRRGRRKPG